MGLTFEQIGYDLDGWRSHLGPLVNHMKRTSMIIKMSGKSYNSRHILVLFRNENSMRFYTHLCVLGIKTTV